MTREEHLQRAREALETTEGELGPGLELGESHYDITSLRFFSRELMEITERLVRLARWLGASPPPAR